MTNGKIQAMKARANMLYAVEIALKHGNIEAAKAIGESSAKVGEKLRNGYYDMLK